MVQGLLLWIEFTDAEAESRFKQWVLRGNQRSGTAPFSFGLRARILKSMEMKYLFFWEHDAMFSFSWLLQVLFWFNARRLRGRYSVRRVRKLELADLILSRGWA